jgi:hypothetical protein
MSLNVEHLRDQVVAPTLQQLGLWSLSAEQLVLGTAAQESRLRHLRQIGSGPARGLWQCEPATHRDIWRSYLSAPARPELRRRVLSVALEPEGAAAVAAVTDDLVERLGERLYGDLRYACAIARVHYWRIPKRLPPEGDVAAQGAYWKTYYNTRLGKGTVEDYLNSWRLYVAPAGIY